MRFEDGVSEVALTLREELCNSWHVAHGGVVMTLLDVTMAHAARTPSPPGEEQDRRGVITIEMKTTFMRPGTGRLLCRGTRLHSTKSLVFCQAELLDAENQLLAQATGTFKFRNRATSLANTESPAP